MHQRATYCLLGNRAALHRRDAAAYITTENRSSVAVIWGRDPAVT